MFARAIEIMSRSPLTFAPDTPVSQAAEVLIQHRLDGACVVDGETLVGVITAMDLVFQERKTPSPGIFMLPGTRRTLEKVTARTVGEIMSANPTTVEPSAELAELAAIMADNHFTILPVVNEGRLVGAVDKWALLSAAQGEGVSDDPT